MRSSVREHSLLRNTFTTARRDIRGLLSPSLTYPVGALCDQQVPCSRLVAQPMIKLSTVDSRTFPVAAAQVWNGLSEAVVSSSSLKIFSRQLKTHLFNFHTLT